MKFEQLDVWKRASRLACDIYKATAKRKDYGFKIKLHVLLFQYPLI